MIKIQASVSKGWLNKNAGFSFDQQYYLNPMFRLEEDRKINAYLRKRFPEFPLYNMEDNLMQAEYYNENLVQVGAIQPNMILAVMLGAKFSFYGDQDADVKGYPLLDITDVSALPSIDDLINHPFIQDLTKEILDIQQSRPDLTVIPPFFWDLSGRATIHGIITTSLKLVGENIMTMLMLDPDLAHAIHLWITEAYIKIISYFSELTKLPVTSIHIGECSGTMLSSDLYEEFVVPYLSILGDKLGKVRIHSCGKTDHLIECLSKIRNLGIIDVGSGTSVTKIREIIGQDVEINIFPSVNLLMKESSQEKLKEWLYNILSENNNGPLKIAYHLENAYSLENCLFLHEELQRLGLTVSGRLY